MHAFSVLYGYVLEVNISEIPTARFKNRCARQAHEIKARIRTRRMVERLGFKELKPR